LLYEPLYILSNETQFVKISRASSQLSS
jgi:hypothetical protein